MFDTHSHLTIEPIYSNIDSVIPNFVNNNGKGILNVGYDLPSSQLVLDIHNKYKDRYGNLISNAIGIHPEHYFEIHQQGKDVYLEFRKINNKLKEIYRDFNSIIHAVGETGLDYYHLENQSLANIDKEVLIEIQKNSFKEHLSIALQYNLPLTIHCRDIEGSDRAIEDILTIISQIGKGRLTGSFHSYTGSIYHLNDILNLGFYIGFNGIITFTNADNVREILLQTPIERVLLETDAPYLIPKEARKEKFPEFDYGIPTNIQHVANKIAQVKNLSIESVYEKTSLNAKNLFFIN